MNAEKISSTITGKVEGIGLDVVERAREIASTVRGKVEEISITVKVTAMAKEVKNEQVEPHKVIMLGGRRAGKSSVLACIVDQLANKTPGDICSVIQTDQGHVFYDNDGKAYCLPPLYEKKIEIKDFLGKIKLPNALFVVDMKATTDKGSYYLQIRTGESATMKLEFVDVPGESMESVRREGNHIGPNPEREELQKQVQESDIFIITIDTPFLMEAGEGVNLVYNRIQEITDIMGNLIINREDSWDKKFVLFCPVKCEKWLKEGKGEMIADKVCRVYRNLINTWVKHPNVAMWIMPVETAGGIEFSKFMDAKRVFKSKEDGYGESCSVNPLTGTIIYRDGRIEKGKNDYVFEDDLRWQQSFHSPIPIPLAWYRSTGEGYSPRLCEQPVYRFLCFLAEKEELINQEKLKKDQDVKRWKRFLRYLRNYRSPFGDYAEEFKALGDKIRQGNLIKESGDGFRKLTEIIK